MTPGAESQQPSIRLAQRVFSLPTLLSFAVALGLIYFLATRFDLDWGETWENVRTMNPWLYLLGFALYYLSFGSRGLKWRMLARGAGMHESPKPDLPSPLRFSQLTIMGWFVNSVAPFRLGEAYRPYALSEDSGGGFPWSLGTVLAERVLDMATVFVMLVVGATWFLLTRDSSGTGFIVVAAVAAAMVLSLALVAVLVVMKGYGTRLARFLPGKLEAAYHRFQTGALGGLRQLPLLFLLAVVSWLLESGRLYFVVQALGLSISLPLVLVAALGHGILSTVPTPGGVGAVEPGVTGLLILEMVKDDAASIVIVDRSITYLSVIILGGLVFFAWHVSRARKGSGVGVQGSG